MTVRDVQNRMTSREFSEWQAYWHIEPFGEERADLRMGILASVMASLWGDGKRTWRAEDFMPFVQADERRPDPPAVQKSIARDIAAAVAAKGKC